MENSKKVTGDEPEKTVEKVDLERGARKRMKKEKEAKQIKVDKAKSDKIVDKRKSILGDETYATDYASTFELNN